MPISTELFVAIVHMIGYPLFLGSISNSEIGGKYCFIVAYTFILLSNIFTVVEDYLFTEFFNYCEHISISIASILLFAAVMKFSGITFSIGGKNGKTPSKQKAFP